MSLDFKNNIKNFKTTSLAIYRRNLSRTISWTVFPRIYTNLQSNACFQFCFQVRRPAISTIADPYMSLYEKWEISYLNIWFMKNSKCQLFYFWKSSPKNWQTFQYSKGQHFSITKLDILIFCKILHLEMGFWTLSWKRIVLS